MITGIYDYQSSVNFDNYLKQLGVNYVLRKLAALASPTVTIGTNCQDHELHVSISITSVVKYQVWVYKFGMTFA